ncbi:helix-turn-helix domain-containing protein [Arcanobacterium hippocoleae]
MSYSRNRAIALAISQGSLTTTQAALRFNVSDRQIRRIMARYRQGGLKALEPQSEAYWVLFAS